MNRREFLRITAAAGAAASIAPSIAAQETRYSKRATRLVWESGAIDMLSSLGMPVEGEGKESDAETFWLSRPEGFTPRDDVRHADSGIRVFALGDLVTDYDVAMIWMAKWNGFIASNSRFLERVDDTRKLAERTRTTKIGIMLTLQDSSHFRTADDVALFFGLGQRVSQLTYNGPNRLGSGAFADADVPLTPFGAEIVKRMNEVGMAIDLSHCGDRTTLDALAASRKPVLITHAACRALNPGYPRAKTDEMIRKMAATGGVMGIPVLRFMIRGTEPVSVEDFLDHIDHVAKLVGVEHVGIGSDESLETEDAMPLEWRRKRLEGADPKYHVHTDAQYRIAIEGIDHPQRTFDIAEGLVRRGYSDGDIRLILGGNFARALGEIWPA
ncbi:MAG TPA: membrane dipeptidase [Thermoanaerobaculia bacterium]|nr:membrane dipeptidase [Thermoanaerobaculia bacterium]